MNKDLLYIAQEKRRDGNFTQDRREITPVVYLNYIIVRSTSDDAEKGDVPVVPPPSCGMPRPLFLDHWLHHIFFLPSSLPPPPLHPFACHFTISFCVRHFSTHVFYICTVFRYVNTLDASVGRTSAPPLSLAILEAPFLCFRFITCLPSPQNVRPHVRSLLQFWKHLSCVSDLSPACPLPRFSFPLRPPLSFAVCRTPTAMCGGPDVLDMRLLPYMAPPHCHF